jgi:hypothetical protein
MPRKRIPRVHQGVRWVEIGSKVRFDPLSCLACSSVSDIREEKVTGTVSYINHRHKWFLVEYGELRTCFKFSDVGLAVIVCG